MQRALVRFLSRGISQHKKETELENAVEYMSCGEEDTCHLTTL